VDRNWTSHLEEQKSAREQAGLIRSLPGITGSDGRAVTIAGMTLVNFSGNDYLGFSREPSITEAGCILAREWGNGSTGSRLMSGNSFPLVELEKRLAELIHTERCLVFNSGWNANLAILSALADKNSVVFCDRLDHASIYDGIRLSGAEMVRYKHADAGDLEKKLAAAGQQRKIIVTDSVFSMDGDAAPLKEIVRLKEQSGALLIVDEAHAFGVYGPEGQGLLTHEGLAGRADLVMATFGKSLGVFGAFVAGSSLLIEHLINTARPFIFTTGLPPFVIGAVNEALRLMSERPRGIELLAKAGRFRTMIGVNEEVGIGSQIIPFMTGTNERALALRDHLRDHGFFVQAIRPPTVPPGTSRVRISLNLLHTEQDLEGLAEAIRIFPGGHS
jgi:8-amino-7-oxononanoate synthase